MTETRNEQQYTTQVYKSLTTNDKAIVNALVEMMFVLFKNVQDVQCAAQKESEVNR